LLTTVDNFTVHMSLYAYSKYILAKVIFGNFDVDYLSKCFNKEFMTALEKSDYREFSKIYTSEEIGLIGFQRYFHCSK